MTTFLFCFGYESPDEWRSNERDGTDFESSNGVWVEAASEGAAIRAGLDFAERHVARLFEEAGIADFPGWHASGYASWIEPDPLERWSGQALDTFPRIRG